MSSTTNSKHVRGEIITVTVHSNDSNGEAMLAQEIKKPRLKSSVPVVQLQWDCNVFLLHIVCADRRPPATTVLQTTHQR